MVFFANSQGVIVTSTNFPLNRGSNLANEIVLVAPFTTLTSVAMQYKTPDGVISALIALTPMEWSTPEEGTTAPKLNAWKVNVDIAMTELTGDLAFQFFLYYHQDGLPVRLATTEAVVKVNRGTFTDIPANAGEQTVIQTLEAQYKAIYEQLEIFQNGANDAVDAAEAAAGSATTAAGYATVARAAAGRAEGAMVNAEAAQEAAETAQGNAEAAQAGAEAARDAVELALQSAFTDYATDITASINETSYIINISLLNNQGTVISTASVDLPLESVVVGGSYANGNVILTLKNGETVTIPVTDLIDGLVSEDKFNDEVARIDTTVSGKVDKDGIKQVTLRNLDYVNSNVLYSESEVVVEGAGGWVTKDFLVLTDFSVGDRFAMSIGSCVGASWGAPIAILFKDASGKVIQAGGEVYGATSVLSGPVVEGVASVVFCLMPAAGTAMDEGRAIYTDIVAYKGANASENVSFNEKGNQLVENAVANSFMKTPTLTASDIEGGDIDETNGELKYSAYYCRTKEFIPIKAGATIKNTNGINFCVREYDPLTMEYVPNANGWAANYTYTAVKDYLVKILWQTTDTAKAINGTTINAAPVERPVFLPITDIVNVARNHTLHLVRSSTVKTISHRGDYKTTLPDGVVPMQCGALAVIAAKRRGYDVTENDVNITSDGIFIMWHYANLQRFASLNYTVGTTKLLDENGYILYLDSSINAYWYDQANDTVYTFDDATSQYVASSVALSSLTVADANNVLVKQFPYSILKRLTSLNGEKLITFDEWVLLCKQVGIDMYVNFKIQPTEDQWATLIGIVRKYGMLKNTSWLIPVWDSAEVIRRYDAKARMGTLSAPVENLVTYYSTYLNEGGFFFDPHSTDLTAEGAALAIDNGFGLECWHADFSAYGFDTEEKIIAEIDRVLALGVQGITLDKYRVEDIYAKRYGFV